MPDAVVPHVITPQKAAGALGLTIAELARNIQAATQERLQKLAREIGSFEVTTLDQFDEQIEGVRRLLESSIACWEAVDGGEEDEPA